MTQQAIASTGVPNELTPEQKKELFDNYEKAKAKVASAVGSLDNTVRIIAGHMGTGPFRWQGQELGIAKRGERLIMRVKGQGVEEIG